MQVASVSTSRPDLRSEIEGWSYEDSTLLVRRSYRDAGGIFIGYTPSPQGIASYVCVLEMLADGWVLLGPPVREPYTDSDGVKGCYFGWWLTRGE